MYYSIYEISIMSKVRSEEINRGFRANKKKTIFKKKPNSLKK